MPTSSGDMSSTAVSSIAILGDESREAKAAAESIGAANFPFKSLTSENLKMVRAANLNVVVLPVALLSVKASHPELLGKKIIAVGPYDDANADSVLQYMQADSLFAWVDSYTTDDFQNHVMSALDQAREVKQASESLAMFFEHNQTLQRLSEELEQRIEQRRTELNDSTWRLQQSQRKSEVMHRALNAVHVSQSIPEIERQLMQILSSQNTASSEAPQIDWVRITFSSQSRLDAAPMDKRAGTVYSVATGGNGHIHFGRSPDRPFRSDDRGFLNPIAEAVTLAVTRLRSLERMEQIKHEWEQTFNAITHPVAVLDENLRLVRGNRALLKGRAPEQVVGRPCFEAVFDRKSACSGCPVMADYTSGRFRQRRRLHSGGGQTIGGTVARTAQFRIDDQLHAQTSEVSSRPLNTDSAVSGLGESGDDAILVHLYRDATTTVQFEKRIVESSKMAELGTIGSSIAHQLNNPIGGMLSHIQLLLMDLKTLNFEGKADLEIELREMENGTRRCAEIVRDLLGFSRRADEDEAHEHDLIEIVRQAMKITELQTRSKGIRFKLELEPSNLDVAPIQGRFNLLAQAVRAILLTLMSGSLRDFLINLKIVKSSDELTVIIGPVPLPNGSQAENHDRSGRLDLTVARQILLEHGGRLELETASNHFEMGKEQLVQRAILSLPLTKVLSP